MKHNIDMKYKILFAVLGFIFITWSMPFIVNAVMTHREEQRRIYYEKMGLKEGFKINDLGKLLGTIFTGILKLLLYFIKISIGLPLLLTGIALHFLCARLEFIDGFVNGLQVLVVLMKCSFDSIKKIFNGKCTLYYIVDVIFGTIYKIVVELPIALFKALLGLDLQFIVDLVDEVIILPIDSLVFAFMGFHITKWPDSVVNNCYKCTGSINQYKDKTLLYSQWAKLLNCTNAEIFEAVYKMIYSMFPIDGHWSTWSKGNHLDGGDNAVD